MCQEQYNHHCPQTRHKERLYILNLRFWRTQGRRFFFWLKIFIRISLSAHSSSIFRLPSVEASLTQIISISDRLWFITLSRHLSRYLSTLKTGIITLNKGFAAIILLYGYKTLRACPQKRHNKASESYPDFLQNAHRGVHVERRAQQTGRRRNRLTGLASRKSFRGLFFCRQLQQFRVFRRRFFHRAYALRDFTLFQNDAFVAQHGHHVGNVADKKHCSAVL